MNTILRLKPYFGPQWRTISLGIGFMAFYAVFSGFSIALILPIMEKVFIRPPEGAGPVIHIGDGLRDTWEGMGRAWGGAEGLSERLTAVRESVMTGLTRIQDQAPPMEVLTWFCVITLVAIFFKNFSDYGRKVAFIRVEQATTEALRRDLFQRVLEFPLSTFNRISSGQFISRIVTDVELVKTLTVNNAANFIHNLLLVIVYLSLSVWASPKLALGSLLIVPPIILMTGKLASKLRRQSARAQTRIAALTSSLNETLGGIRIVKAFGMEPREHQRFSHSTSGYRKTVVRLMSMDALAAPLSEFWGVAIGVCVLYFGGKIVLDPDSSLGVGRFFLFLFALVSTLHPLKQLSSVVTRFQRGAAAAGRLFEVLDMPGERDSEDALPITGLGNDLVFDGVSFLYEPGKPVLREISLRAPAGSTTALVGPSGAGKSTLVDLIPRFFDPDSGSILADGIDLRRLRRRELRRLIGIVSQEPILFDDSVFNNIAYGREEATEDEVVEAARVANAHEFIEAMTEGYRTPIGERGVRLSGGQRQRLAIARAVLRNPDILILDEATSSLDSESETLVQEALERLLEGRTTFIIAHRLSTIMKADQILVLDAGRLVERGTHADLLTQGGLYQRLHSLQFRNQEAPSLDTVES